MRWTAPTRLLLGVALLWVSGRVVGVTLGSTAMVASTIPARPIALEVPQSHIDVTAPADVRRDLAEADMTVAAAPYRSIHLASPMPSAANALTAVIAPPLLLPVTEESAAIAGAQLLLLQRLVTRRPAYGLAQRWQWRDGAGSVEVAALPRAPASRWSLSAWAVVRAGDGSSAAIAPAALGGSQIGTRLAYRLDRGNHWEAFARANSVGRLGDGAEAAAGLSWQPLSGIPARLTVERRQRLLGRDERGAFAAYASGGVSQMPLAAGWRIDGYGAAGMVGATDPLPFVEGQVTATHPIVRHGPVTVSGGGGLWAAVQSDVARVDIGPRLSIDAGTGVPRVALDWRQRVAGNAAPSSGPALTVGIDF